MGCRLWMCCPHTPQVSNRLSGDSPLVRSAGPCRLSASFSPPMAAAAAGPAGADRAVTGRQAGREGSRRGAHSLTSSLTHSLRGRGGAESSSSCYRRRRCCALTWHRRSSRGPAEPGQGAQRQGEGAGRAGSARGLSSDLGGDWRGGGWRAPVRGLPAPATLDRTETTSLPMEAGRQRAGPAAVLRGWDLGRAGRVVSAGAELRRSQLVLSAMAAGGGRLPVPRPFPARLPWQWPSGWRPGGCCLGISAVRTLCCL